VGRSSWLDLDVRGRTLFAALYLALQAGLVLSSPLRPDGVFSFQMFNESSTILIRLGRRVSTPEGERNVPVNGPWSAWNERVKDPILGTVGREVHASYGVEAQLFRLQKALDDVASHLDHDTETVALLADVEVRRNGRPPVVRHFESARRIP
jgi:hypothetical protein